MCLYTISRRFELWVQNVSMPRVKFNKNEKQIVFVEDLIMYLFFVNISWYIGRLEAVLMFSVRLFSIYMNLTIISF